MRLTLRTLLAYLDNTLDPQDAEALRDKLSESGFATQLVQRMRSTLANASLPAPSPEAVGPVEDANVISEYLDSTLPHEQVAEIERACLESDPHLAEAAACHQILTMILGKPAEVSPELRQRVYELPDRAVEDIAGAGSFSAVSIPVDGPQLRPLSDELPTAELTTGRDARPVQPVGVSDSGVSDAPTRLREAEQSVESQAGGGAAIAGSKPRSIDQPSQGFGGSIRPSRIAPLVVSLALTAVLLFALTRIFQPLLNPKITSMDLGNTPIGEIVVPADQAPVMVDLEDSAESTSSDAEMLPAPEAAATPEETQADPKASSPSDDPTGEDATTPASGQAATREGSPAADASPAEAAATAEMPNATSDSETPAGKTPPDASAAAPPAPNTAPTPAAVPKTDPPEPPPAAELVTSPKNEIAKITSDESLMAGLAGDQWVRLQKDMIVGEGLKVVCAPSFRGQMATESALLTIVGPAQVQWLVGEKEIHTLSVDFGRVLVSATKPNASLNVQLGEETVQLNITDVGTVAAASTKYFGAPGYDPLLPENHKAAIGILSVQGTLKLVHQGKDETLDTGQQWVKKGTADVEVSPMESIPGWIDPPDPSKADLESSARSGLIELLKAEQPIEIALREATLFRRTEVGALAAQTLLYLGRGDVYFGGDGILSTPKQRAYWPDHFMTLLATVDRSAEAAQQLFDSIDSMDSANAKPLFRLLTGYSQPQLIEGGDEQLIELLDSPSMAVRVMALENLHRITGTTLYYRAEQENAVRRAPVIKKWIARQRKGDIRWQE